MRQIQEAARCGLFLFLLFGVTVVNPDFEPYNPRQAAEFARAIMRMKNGESILNYMAPLTEGWPASRTLSEAAATVRSFQLGMAFSADRTVILIGPTPSNLAGIGIQQFYYESQHRNPGWGENAAIFALLDNALTGTPIMDIPFGSKVSIAGYSAGGAAAFILAAAMSNRDRQLQISVASFSEPKPADRRWSFEAPEIWGHRWHAPEDPISHMPLNMQESRLMNIFTPIWQTALTDLYAHPCFGSSIDRNGIASVLTPGEVPPATGVPVANLAAWATALDSRPIVGHSIEEMVRRLDMAAGYYSGDNSRYLYSRPGANAPTFYGSRGTTGLPLPELNHSDTIELTPPTTREDNRAYRQATQAAGFDVPPTDIIPSVVKGMDLYRPYWVGKEGATWTVYYQQQPLFEVASKSAGRKRARQLNSLTSLLYSEPDSDVIGLAESILAEGFNDLS